MRPVLSWDHSKSGLYWRRSASRHSKLLQSNVFTASKISISSVKCSEVINGSNMLDIEALHYWANLTAFVLVGFDRLGFRSNGNSFWRDSFYWDSFWWDLALMGCSLCNSLGITSYSDSFRFDIFIVQYLGVTIFRTQCSIYTEDWQMLFDFANSWY